MTSEFGTTSLLFGLQVLWREQVVVVNVDREIKCPHNRRSNIKRCLKTAIKSQLLYRRFLQIGNFKHLRVQIPVALIVHFDQLLLKRLLQLLNFFLVLLLQLRNFLDVKLATVRLQRCLLLIRLLLLLAQQLNVLNQRGNWIRLSSFLLLGHALVDCIHQ